MALGYQRCPEDDCRAGTAALGFDKGTGQVIEADIHVISAIVAVHSAILALSSSMKAGHEDDFLEKVSLGLVSKIVGDPHSICPLVNLMGLIGVLATNKGTMSTDPEGRVIIIPLGASSEDVEDFEYPDHTCPLTDWEEPDDDEPPS